MPLHFASLINSSTSSVSVNEMVVVNLILLFALKATSLGIGYLTIRLGFVLLQSGAKGEFKFSAKFAGGSADLASVSPGLLFVLLGVLLIGYAITVDKIVEFRERAGQAGVSSEITESENPPEVELPPVDPKSMTEEEKETKGTK